MTAVLDPVALSLHSGGLAWSLKTSFVQYISAMSDGRCSTTDGASVLSGTIFFFEHLATENGSIRFRGDVRFAGHHGMLFVCIADPIIHLDHQDATITVYQPRTGLLPDERVAFATAHIIESTTSAGAPQLSASQVQLTHAGAEIFGNVYKPGDLLDDFIVVLPDSNHIDTEGPTL